MRIVHIVYGLPIGGIETMLVNIANIQAESGHDIHVIIINNIIDKSLLSRIDAKVSIHCMNRKKGSRNPHPILKMNYKLWKIKPDVVHLHISSISKYIFVPSIKRKLCTTLHSLCNEENTKNIKNSGPIFSISNSVKYDLKEKLGLNAITVTNGIDLTQISYKKKESLSSLTFNIVQVGRLNIQYKGQDILIRAVDKRVKEGRQVRLTLIGDGKSRAELEDLVSELGLNSIVTFLGNQSQEYVLSHLSDYDLFVLPSRFEGFGLAVAEAMAIGVPVLVSDNDGPVDIIANGRYGYIFKREDWVECASSITKIMDEYPDEKFLSAARVRIEANYTVQATAVRYLQIYEQCVVR